MHESPEKLQDLSDEKLADLVIQGRHDAFTCLVKRHVTKFYHLAFRILNSREDAQDAVSECWLKFWHDPTKWNGAYKVKFTTWFYRVVINKCYDHRKKIREIPLAEDFDVKDDSASADILYHQNQQNLIFEKALASLENHQRTALILSFFENKKNEESAKIMKLSLKAFQSLLLRSKNALKEKFIKLGGNNE